MDSHSSDEEYIDNDRNVPQKIPKKRTAPKKAKTKTKGEVKVESRPEQYKFVVERGKILVKF